MRREQNKMTDAITYLESSHKLRRNVLTGELLYADTDGWHKLSKEGRNTIMLNAMRDGVSLTEEVLDRFARSTLVEQWNPARQWLDELPEWDGEDHVLELSQRVITSNPDWAERFHKWMLQTVARWMDMEVPHRDVIVPVIVGQWGYGKTSFCYQLLPPELRLYYTDKIKLSTSAEVYELLTTNLLVNIDEFYQESPLQEPLVRYLFSRSTPVFHRPYGTTEETRRNYAGFIATTGNLHPMTDAAGAAHLFCIEAGRKIDLTPMPYEQIYAQLKEELESGTDYLLSDDERERMAGQNSPFEEADNLVKMVRQIYANPPKGQKAKAVYIDTIIDRLMQEYPYWTPGEHVNQDVGFALQDAGFTRSRIHGRSCYRIVPRDPRRLDFSDDSAEEKKEDEFADNPLAQALLAGLGKR